MNEPLLARRRAVITGASRGLGEAIARQFWEHGASLLLAARHEEDLQRVAASLPLRSGQTVHCAVVDLAARDPSPAQQMAQSLQMLGDPLHILVNNAGMQGPIGPLSAQVDDWETWLRTIVVNFLAPARLIAELAPRLADGGVIINVAGGGATGPRPNFSAYATAKTALVRLTECLAEELRDRRIRVLALAPGILPTTMLLEVASADPAVAGIREVEAARRALNTPDAAAIARAARCALWMASDASAGITGRLISAVWDPWPLLRDHADEIARSDLYTLRRIVPRDRGLDWGQPFDSGMEPPTR